MSNLALVKSEMFGSVQCDFYQDGETFAMTIAQLASALGYASKNGVEVLLKRNKYLKDNEFSGTYKLTAPDGKVYDTRLFSEDGIYEVTMLAKTEKAKEFRAWVRKILKALRKGEVILVKPNAEGTSPAELKRQELANKAKNAEARLKDATLRQANFLLSELDKRKGVLSTQSVELLTINAIEMIAGKNTLPRPKVEEKFYTATEIAKVAGVSANKIGKIANANKLKTDEYGITVLDKSPYSAKQVPAFRYNERGRVKLMELIQNDDPNKEDSGEEEGKH